MQPEGTTGNYNIALQALKSTYQNQFSGSHNMRIKGEQSNTGEPTTRLQILERPVVGSGNFADSGIGSIFTPGSINTPSAGIDPTTVSKTPEKKLALFAFNLAVLEKAASGLGTLAFIWATVVLLGGFADSLRTKDFWFVTVILLISGTRIFGRSHELEWQHHASLGDAGRYSFRVLVSSSRILFRAIKAVFQPLWAIRSKGRQITHDIETTRDPQNQGLPPKTQRAWSSSDVALFHYPGWFFISRNISRTLHWLQILSALTCMTLSLMRLISHDYGSHGKNLYPVLDIFYGLALAEALMFLLEKAYWEWMITVRNLLDEVSRQCELGPSGVVSMRRFFYDAYSCCINGSSFDVLRMNLVSFAGELLDSDSHDEQLIGAEILNKLVKSKDFSSVTLRKIGTSASVIERLVDMLNWNNQSEEEIRRSTAEIISKLAGRKQNVLRLASIPGAMESISSLLNTGRSSDAKPYEISDRRVLADQTNYDFSVFNRLGLLILKKLAQDHDNCFKIGNARGLLAKIIDFTSTGERVLRNNYIAESQIKLVKRSLQVLKMLASSTGQTGKMLRKRIAEIVFTVSNIREILEYGENHMMLQKLGIEILTSLSMDEDAKDRIGSTGGVIKLLLCIFFKLGLTDDQNTVRNEAGEALAMLALESEKNCHRILRKGDVVEQLVGALKDSVVRVNASRILRNLCAFSRNESFSTLMGVTAAIPTVLNTIMVKEKKQLEASIGLVAQVFKFTNPEEYDKEFKRAGITDIVFTEKLVQILKEYKYPDTRVPRMRRFVLQLAIWMMKSHPKYIQFFKRLSMMEVLECVAETTSELECFNAFSGSVGVSRHKLTTYSLVDTAMELIAEG